MRAVAALLILAGCGSEGRLEVRYVLPDGAPSLEDAIARVIVGEEDADGFRTLAGTGAPATVDPAALELIAPPGVDRRVRVLVHDDDFNAILHGTSSLFEIEVGAQVTPVEVPLSLPPEGRITSASLEGNTVTLEMEARRFEKVQIGRQPRQPEIEAERVGGGPPSDAFDRFAVEFPLGEVDCILDRGCPIMLFVDFIAGGVAGPTATAVVTLDRIAPALSTRARIEGGTHLGEGSRLLVAVEASEPVVGAEVRLERKIERGGSCPMELGWYPCDSTNRSFTCSVAAPESDCDGSYAIEVKASDAAGNPTSVTGAEIGVDTIPPGLTVSSIVCSSTVAVVAGTAVDATQVALEDANGELIAWAAGPAFRLATRSSTVAVVAIDGGANETRRDAVCP